MNGRTITAKQMERLAIALAQPAGPYEVKIDRWRSRVRVYVGGYLVLDMIRRVLLQHATLKGAA